MQKISRQALVGMLQRKKFNRETNASLAELRHQNSQRRNEADLKDKRIQEQEIELKRLSNENAEQRSKMKENDLWFSETFKYLPQREHSAPHTN